MNWRDLVIETFKKLSGMVNRHITELNLERLSEQVYLKRAVSLVSGDQSVNNLYNTLMREGFVLASKVLVDGFIERVFHTGISILTSFGYLEEALQDSEKLNYVIDNLSDEESKKVFKDFVEFQIIKSFVGEGFLYSRDGLVKITDEFNSNLVVRNFMRYKLSSPELIKIEGDVVEVNTKFGGIRVKKFFSHEVLAEVEYEQYSYNNLRVESGDVVLDIGAFNGITAVYFARRGAKIIHSFEPLAFEELLETLDLNGVSNVIPVNKAVSRKEEILYVNFFPGGGIYVSRVKMKNTSSIIKATSIDNYVETSGVDRVDFVKMDIEGWEMEALQGMRKVLKEYRPKVTLAAYHKLTNSSSFSKGLDTLNFTFHITPNWIYLRPHDFIIYQESRFGDSFRLRHRIRTCFIATSKDDSFHEITSH